MHKLTQINRNNFPVAPEKDIAVESFAEDNKGMIYLKEHTHIYRLSTEKMEHAPLSPNIIHLSLPK